MLLVHEIRSGWVDVAADMISFDDFCVANGPDRVYRGRFQRLDNNVRFRARSAGREKEE